MLQAVSVKLPQLWTSRVAVWFAQAEAQFATKGVTASLTKYFYVVQSLPEKTADRIPALLQAPPRDDPYQTLKDKLMDMYELTDFQRAELLTALPPAAADVRPSELLDRMLALVPPGQANAPTSCSSASRVIMAASTDVLDPSADSQLHAVVNCFYCFIHKR